jgi:hypothetical protein
MKKGMNPQCTPRKIQESVLALCYCIVRGRNSLLVLIEPLARAAFVRVQEY